VDIFTRQLGFGCEADDPMNALAFNDKHAPPRRPTERHVRLRHRPLGRARPARVLPEAWELVEDGHLTEHDFADFACGNVVRTAHQT
jgi:hypothetical protein